MRNIRRFAAFLAICRGTQAIWFACGQTIERVKARATPESARKLFLEYVREINPMRKRPQWYNAPTSKCITDIAGAIDSKTRLGNSFSRSSPQTCSGLREDHHARRKIALPHAPIRASPLESVIPGGQGAASERTGYGFPVAG